LYNLEVSLLQNTTEYPLDQIVMGIGRSEDNQIVIEDSQISRHHARIELKNEELYITDLGSSNGTSINGAAIEPELQHRLKPGDVINMGNASLTVRLTSPVTEAPAAAATPLQQSPATQQSPASQTASVKKNSWIKWFVVGVAIVVVAIGVFMVVNAISSPSGPDTDRTSSSMQTYFDDEHQFYFTYPMDWEEMPPSVYEDDEGIIAGFWTTTEEYGVTTNMLIATEELSESMDIDDYFDLAKQSFDDEPHTLSKKNIRVAGYPAIRWIYKIPTVDSMTQMQATFIREDTAWVLIFTCADEAFDENEATFDSMIDSVSFKDGDTKILFSTAKLSEATMATGVDADMRPVNATDVFKPDTPVIHCSVKLSNAPDDTEVKAEWIYVQGEREDLNGNLIDSTIVFSEGTRYIDFSLSSSESGWPIGDYEVILYVDGKEAMNVPFSVKQVNTVLATQPAPLS
jgi:hypothetical protein